MQATCVYVHGTIFIEYGHILIANMGMLNALRDKINVACSTVQYCSVMFK